MTGLARSERIRRRAEYQQIYERGVKVHGRYLTLFLLANGLADGPARDSGHQKAGRRGRKK